LHPATIFVFKIKQFIRRCRKTVLFLL